MSTSVSRETVPAAQNARNGAPASVSRETEARRSRQSPLAILILLPIRAYRRFLSPAVSPRCRYYPSCSSYAMQSIEELGAVRGTVLAAWRVLRCNPFSKGGVDPVSDRPLFRARPDRPDRHQCSERPDPA